MGVRIFGSESGIHIEVFHRRTNNRTGYSGLLLGLVHRFWTILC